MEISKEGIALIKKFEGLKLEAYKAVTTEKFYTIGWGHYGADVSAGMTITKKEADALLKKDLAKYGQAVRNLNQKWTQNEFDALVSFTYNCGAANLKRLVANRDHLQIADAFLLYNKAGGRVLKGLVIRRKAEREMFLKDNTLEQIAREVIDGKWGNGRIRKEKLTAAGYDYYAVQTIVNRLLVGS